MPKLLNEKRLNKVQYISMSDYIRSMDALDDFEDKMNFTTRYLLAYGAGQRDVSFAEAVHIAKLKIAEASKDIRNRNVFPSDEAVNPELSEEEDAPNRLFMIDPVQYLKNEANKLLIKEDEKGITAENQQRVENYQVMFALLANDVDNAITFDIQQQDVEPEVRDFNYRFKAIYGGDQQLEKAYNKTKPGVLSKMFGTSSVAAHNLDEAYKAFNNEEHALYGNLSSLDKAATEYLQHVFPKWDPKNGPISKADIERLSGTKKARAMFSYNILQTTTNQRLTEKVYETITTANIQKRADLEAQAGDEVLDDNFQENLFNDVNEKNNIEVDPKAEEDYHANFVADPELDD